MPVSITLPSHTNILTGLNPYQHGVRENARFLAERHPLLAEKLKGAGYQTAAFVSAFAAVNHPTRSAVIPTLGITRAYRVAGLPFGVTPRTAWATVEDDQLLVHFGPWRMRTSLGNIADATITGGFAFIKTAGPAHLSLADRGLTFATNGDRGVCISFREPVSGIEPTGRIRHPNLTVTVTDCDGLAWALAHRPAP